MKPRQVLKRVVGLHILAFSLTGCTGGFHTTDGSALAAPATTSATNSGNAVAGLPVPAPLNKPFVTLQAPQMTTKSVGGTTDNGEAWVLWSNGYLESNVEFPTTGTYALVVQAYSSVATDPGAEIDVRIDGMPKDHLRITNTTAQAVTLTAFVAAGSHRLGVGFDNDGIDAHGGDRNLIVKSVAVTLTAVAPVLAGHRDPTRQPFSSYSIWNTALGSGALWSQPGDLDTVDLRHPNSTINAGTWSIPVYTASASDGTKTFRNTDNIYPMADVTLHAPTGLAPASGGDEHITLFDISKRWFFQYFGCVPTADGFACGLGQKDDVCGDGLGAYGWSTGVIRRWELEAGAIHHMLRYSLPTSLTKSGGSFTFGQAWPTLGEDYVGSTAYTGHILHGSTVGIPASVDLNSLGLSKSGRVLAQALQDYGAIQRDTGGSDGIIFYAEQAAEGAPELNDMRTDLPKIVAKLAVLRNQAPATPNGGGTRRQPTAEGIDAAVCPAY